MENSKLCSRCGYAEPDLVDGECEECVDGGYERLAEYDHARIEAREVTS